MGPSLLLPVVILVGMYFLMIRPQQKRMREREAMIRSAGVGDEVATVGGVIGVIVAEEGPEVVNLEVDTDVELRVQRRAIGEIITSSDISVEDTAVADTSAEDSSVEDIDDADEAIEHDGPISEG